MLPLYLYVKLLMFQELKLCFFHIPPYNHINQSCLKYIYKFIYNFNEFL